MKKIRQALVTPTPLPFPKSEGSDSVYHASVQEMEIEFAEQFTKLQGRFIFCADNAELAFQLNELALRMKWERIYCVEPSVLQQVTGNIPDVSKQLVTEDLPNCDVSITGCEQLVARTGTIVMSAAQPSGRNTSVYAPIHICIARTSQLVYDVRDALVKVKERYKENLPSLVTFATGPSRTADIEKTLVVGVHGPKEVYVFLVESTE